jgi:hypothetical protein
LGRTSPCDQQDSHTDQDLTKIHSFPPEYCSSCVGHILRLQDT